MDLSADEFFPGLLIRTSDLCEDAPLEPRLQPGFKRCQLFGRSVGSQYHPTASRNDGIEGIENFLLGRLFSGKKLHIIQKKQIRRTEFLVKGRHFLFLQCQTHSVDKIITPAVKDFLHAAGGACFVDNGI